MKVRVTKIEADSFGELLMKIAAQCAESTCGNVPAKVEPEVNLDFFIESIAEKKGWKPERVYGWLKGISELNPMSAFNIVLREVAVYLDRKYEDHIQDSEKIYAISPLDGRIHELNKKHIKNYRNFAAFRTIEDAKTACRILRYQLKDMFKSNAEG